MYLLIEARISREVVILSGTHTKQSLPNRASRSVKRNPIIYGLGKSLLISLGSKTALIQFGFLMQS